MSVLSVDKLNVRGDRLMLKMGLPEAMSDGGIYIPDVAQEEGVYGVVVGVGDGVKDEHYTVGTEVYIARFVGKRLKHDGVEYLIVDTDNVLVVIDGE